VYQAGLLTHGNPPNPSRPVASGVQACVHHIRLQQRELLPVYTAFPFHLSVERTQYGLKDSENRRRLLHCLRVGYFRCMEMSAAMEGILSGDRRMIARAITRVENDLPGAFELLAQLPIRFDVPVLGITGPPGAGKSTLISALVRQLITRKGASGNPFQVAVVAVDPTSPFTRGSLLGDRLRMHEHFNSNQVFIRSLATRGALGGLSATTLQVCDVLRSAPFDAILVETVGVGQSEVEVVSLADSVAVVLVPEAGDEIQALKSGIMEIGDIFVVNKSDREGADRFASGLIKTLHERPMHNGWTIPVIQTVAGEHKGVEALIEAFFAHAGKADQQRKNALLAQRAYRLVQHRRMRNLPFETLSAEVSRRVADPDFNLYRLVEQFG
jgi:LAO/AO transport system kinase